MDIQKRAQLLMDTLAEYESEGAHFDSGQLCMAIKLTEDGSVGVPFLQRMTEELAEVHGIDLNELGNAHTTLKKEN